jgi:hypothetical protein
MKLSDFLLRDIPLRHGKILYLDIDIDLEKKFEEQKWSYKEDMLQIGFDDLYTIDVGWSPEHEKNGNFILTVVKDFDWHEPLIRKKIKSFQSLKKNLEDEIIKLELLFQ